MSLEQKLGSSEPGGAVRAASPSSLVRPGEVALLLAYRDSCPYCRALHRSLLQLKEAIERENNQFMKILLYDTARPGNSGFANGTLRVEYVPKLYWVRYDNGRAVIVPWRDDEERQVSTARSPNGDIQKTLPVSSIVRHLTLQQRAALP